jgi:hypothetical protein
MVQNILCSVRLLSPKSGPRTLTTDFLTHLLHRKVPATMGPSAKIQTGLLLLIIFLLLSLILITFRNRPQSLKRRRGRILSIFRQNVIPPIAMVSRITFLSDLFFNGLSEFMRIRGALRLTIAPLIIPSTLGYFGRVMLVSRPSCLTTLMLVLILSFVLSRMALPFSTVVCLLFIFLMGIFLVAETRLPKKLSRGTTRWLLVARKMFFSIFRLILTLF